MEGWAAPSCSYAVGQEQERGSLHGAALSAPKLAEGEYRLYGEDGSFLALSRCEKGKLVTIKSFYEV